MKARFLYKMPNARLLRNNVYLGKGKKHEYIIERVVYLSRRDFIPFREHLLEDNAYIINHKNDMFVDENNVWHVLMFCCIQADIMILVNSEGFNYARYSAIISNGDESIEPRFTNGQRYFRSRKTNCRNATSTK